MKNEQEFKKHKPDYQEIDIQAFYNILSKHILSRLLGRCRFFYINY